MSDEGLTCLTLLRSSVRNEIIEGLTKLKKIFVENLEEADLIIKEFLQNYAKRNADKSPNEIEVEFLIATCILLHANEKHYVKIPVTIFMELRARALSELSQASDLNLRQTSGSYIGSLCKRMGSQIYLEIKDEISTQMQEVIKRCNSFKQQNPQSFDFGNKFTEKKMANKHINLPTTPPSSPVLPDIFKATSAWKLLDTWLYTLKKISSTLGNEFCSYIDRSLVNNLEGAMKNEERFVRESCCALLQCLIVDCSLYQTLSARTSVANYDATDILGSLVKIICLGMCDAWPDVRLPACIAARQILLASKSGSGIVEDKLLVDFLPYLCFNRYSTAEGLQKYSQDSWVELTNGMGKELIEDNFTLVFNLYRTMIVRSPGVECKEIALYCLSECVKKLDKALISQFIWDIFEAIGLGDPITSSDGGRGGVFDGPHSVKEAGCSLVNNILQFFPKESMPYVSSLSKAMLSLVEDSSSAVRESSAAILAVIVGITKDSVFLEDIFLKIKNNLTDLTIPEMNKKENDTEKYNNNNNEDNMNNDNRNNNDNNDEEKMIVDDEIEDERMVLENRLNAFQIDTVNSKATIINFPQAHKTKVETWEKAEGAVFLLRSLSAIKTTEIADKIASLIPLLIKTIYVKNYEGRAFYVESVLRQIPEIFQKVDKKIVKRYLEWLFDVLIEFYPTHNLVRSTINMEAVNCLGRLSNIIGPNILAAKLKEHDPMFYEKFFQGV